jgi:hypothetical protein
MEVYPIEINPLEVYPADRTTGPPSTPLTPLPRSKKESVRGKTRLHR